MNEKEDNGTELEKDQEKTEEIEDPRAIFGTLIKSVREQAGITIAQAALSTKISQPFVEALEQGEFEKLPGIVFGKGFIRSLCQVYDEPPQKYLDAYDLSTSKLGLYQNNIVSNKDGSAGNVRLRGEIRDSSQIIEKLRMFHPGHYFRSLPLYGLFFSLFVVCVLLYYGVKSFTSEPASEPVVVKAPPSKIRSR